MGRKLDGLYHAVQLPGKFKMAVSGCKINCAESSVHDFGLIGEADGWKVVVGNVGVSPRIADEVAKGLDDQQALDYARRVIAYYTENATKGERLGKMIERIGLDALKAALR
jgi:NAD(P)H-nitrite reductase large subunit